MAKVQDRPGTINTPSYANSTFSVLLPYWPNGICTNQDSNKCAVGGRNLLKVFNIEEKAFVEVANLVVGPKKLNYSITDVKWHPVEENIIGSSAGNGAVILWDLNKVNESKQDHLFEQHDRYVNKLCFHPSDPVLMSCSQDCKILCFDIRQKKLSSTFQGKSDGIRDVQCHPTNKFLFASASESGYVQAWDMRRPDHYLYQFTAHSGPVFTLNWHLDEPTILSTGGRDKTIKVWDVSNKVDQTHTIHTIAPIHCLKWRPNHKFHLASCAFVLDYNVTIWDIRRPYVPFAAFSEHTDVAMGIAWRKDPEMILSCSKDKLLYNHAMIHAERPAAEAQPLGLSLSSKGVIAHAIPDIMLKRPAKNNTGPTNLQQQMQTADFKPILSQLSLFNINSGMADVETTILEDSHVIERLAKQFWFHGKSVSILCDHNTEVCASLSLSQKALVWSILKQFYGSKDDGLAVENKLGIGTKKVSSHSNSSYSSLDQMEFASRASLNNRHDFNQGMDSPENIMYSGLHGNHANNNNPNNNNGSTTSGDEFGIHTPSSLVHGTHVNNDLSMVGAELDDVFNDEDYSRQLFSSELEADENELDCVPDEAIQLRQSFGDKAIDDLEQDDLEDTSQKDRTSIRPLSLSALDVPDWPFEPLIRQLILFYADQGDIQMSVTIMLVLQNHIHGMFTDEEIEDWYTGYLDILSQLSLFNIATEVINCAPEPINHLNQNSTTVHIQCQACNKSIMSAKPGWHCETCMKITQNCAVCHIPVNGLFVWCQGCGHGGHLEHMRKWFDSRVLCPTGCGHKCEYS